jgi:HAD superfamily hydrolase (TIGR01450 family)
MSMMPQMQAMETSVTGSTVMGLKSSDVSIAQRYRLALVDLDGVVYRGANPVAYAHEAVQLAEQSGLRMEYTTNNPSRYPSVVADQLRSFGIELDDSQVITSAMVTASMIAQKLPKGSRILAVGSEHVHEELEKAGFVLVNNADDKPHAIVQSWYQEIGWQDLAQESYAVENGALFYTTNRDLQLPREQGIAPGNGSLVEVIVFASGRQPVGSAGKPEPAMYDEAKRIVSQVEGFAGLANDDCIAVGDRLDTDIEAANRGGYDSLLVLTGVTTPQALMTAVPVHRATYVSADLRGLNSPHPAPSRQPDGSWVCTSPGGVGARAWIEGDGGAVHLEVEALGLSDSSAWRSSVNALRAACSLAWEVADSGVDMGSVLLPQFDVEGMFDEPER